MAESVGFRPSGSWLRVLGFDTPATAPPCISKSINSERNQVDEIVLGDEERRFKQRLNQVSFLLNVCACQ